MKYQNFAIVFVLIVLPLSLVLSYYIQNKTDTMVLQTTYQTKLDDSTYDAVAAYQINSLNTQRMKGESVQSYVEASISIFFTTLTTNLGMSSASKQKVQNYIPAILFTTYDGYYIYSPTKTPQVAYSLDDGVTVLSKDKEVVYAKEHTPEDTERVSNTTLNTLTEKMSSEINGNYTTNINEANKEYNYMVKPFIYYSAQYKGTGYNFVASYTLDNYITLYGESDKVKTESGESGESTGTFSKSGYLIDPDKITVNGTLLVEAITKKDKSTLATYESNSEPQIKENETFMRQ